MSSESAPPPLVSIVVIAYRQPRFLNEALESVRRQTLQDYEIIVVDDCSGAEVVDQYRLPPQARLICHEARGGAAAITRNTGLRSTRGRYVAFLDQDDAWLPEKLARQVQALEDRPEAALVFCHHVVTDRRLEPRREQPAPVRLPADPVRGMIARNFIRTPSSVLVRREALDRCGLFDESIVGASDRDFWLRVAARYPVVSLPEPLTLYRMHPDQLHLQERGTRAGRLEFHEKTLAWAERERPDLVPAVRHAFVKMLRKIALIQLTQERRTDLALSTVRRALGLEPWSVRSLLLFLRARFARGVHAPG